MDNSEPINKLLYIKQKKYHIFVFNIGEEEEKICSGSNAIGFIANKTLLRFVNVLCFDLYSNFY